MSTFLAFLLIAYAASSAKATKLVGGDVADIANFPYQVSMFYYDSFLCTGAIISKTAVLTTASCMSGAPSSGMYIRAGSSNRSEGGVTVPVESVNPHPLHTMLEADYDISVLILGTPLEFGETINYIQMPTEYETVPEGFVAVITGFGNYFDPMSDSLMVTTIITMSQVECQNVYGSLLTGRMFCLRSSSIGDACEGDRGAPVVIDGVLMGVISWGYGCGNSDFPRVSSSVSSMRSFIAEVAKV